LNLYLDVASVKENTNTGINAEAVDQILEKKICNLWPSYWKMRKGQTWESAEYNYHRMIKVMLVYGSYSKII
jgi:hypothetical protein